MRRSNSNLTQPSQKGYNISDDQLNALISGASRRKSSRISSNQPKDQKDHSKLEISQENQQFSPVLSKQIEPDEIEVVDSKSNIDKRANSILASRSNTSKIGKNAIDYLREFAAWPKLAFGGKKITGN